jgi:hypothetical protein
MAEEGWTTICRTNINNKRTKSNAKQRRSYSQVVAKPNILLTGVVDQTLKNRLTLAAK